MKIELQCEICGNKFERNAGEVNRNKKLNRRVFCSLECTGKGTLDNLPKDRRYHPENLIPDNRFDELSPFRWHLRNMRRRHKQCTVTLEDLQLQWDSQQGICPYTGWQLKQMSCGSRKFQLPKTPDRASVDRIDSSKGYEKGNIEFVAMIVQFAKNGWNREDVIDFCKAVVEHTA